MPEFVKRVQHDLLVEVYAPLLIAREDPRMPQDYVLKLFPVVHPGGGEEPDRTRHSLRGVKIQGFEIIDGLTAVSSIAAHDVISFLSAS